MERKAKVALVTVCIIALIGCVAYWQLTLPKTRKLVIYGWAGPWPGYFQKWNEELKSKYNIEIEYIPGSGADIYSRLESEGFENPKADLVVTSPDYAFLLASKGVLANIPWKELENAKYVDEKFKQFKNVEIFSIDVALLGHLPQYVSADEINSYRDLADPKWDGKIMVRDPRTAQASWLYFSLRQKYSEEEAWDIMVKIYKNAIRYTTGSGDVERALSAAEAWMMPVISAGQITLIKVQSGVECRGKVPEEGAMLMINCIVMLKNAPHPEAAKIFLDYILSETAQRDMANSGSVAPVNKNVQPLPEFIEYGLGGSSLEEVLSKSFIPDWTTVGSQIPDLLNELQQRLQEG